MAKDNPLYHEILDLYNSTDSWKEGVSLEFKGAQGGLPKDFWPTYSAFANTDGGIVLLGVSDSGEIEGLKKIDSRKNDLAIQLNNKDKCSVNLLADPNSILEIQIGDRSILAIKIPQAQINEKPVHINGNMKNSYFRQHESDIQCPESMLEQFIRDRSDTSQDSYIFPNTYFHDLDEKTFQQFRNRMASVNPEHQWLELTDNELLSRLGGFRKNRITNEEGLTLAGLLMFGKTETINELFPKFKIDYFDIDETCDTIKRWANRITADGTWHSNLYQFFFKVLNLLNKDLKTPFELKEDMSRKGATYAHIAIREALVNALVHADYRGEGGIIIRRTPQGIILKNPGSLLVCKEHIFDGGHSVCRNKNLQTMFQFMGMAEKAGSGIDKIVKGWLDQFLCPPEVDEIRRPNNAVEWTLPYLGFIPKERIDIIVNRIGLQYFEQLHPCEQLILLLIPDDTLISHQDLSKKIPIHRSDLSKHLSKLSGLGYLIAQGRGRATRYQMNMALQNGIANSVHNDANSVHNDANSVHNDANSVHNDANSIHNDANSVHNKKTGNIPINGAGGFIQTSPQFEEKLLVYKSKKRHSPEDTDNIILALCEGNWLSAAEIAFVLERNPDSLRRNIIQTLVRHNRLKMKYSQQNHKQQSYTTSDILI